jgi:hypothetical protein
MATDLVFGGWTRLYFRVCFVLCVRLSLLVVIQDGCFMFVTKNFGFLLENSDVYIIIT